MSTWPVQTQGGEVNCVAISGDGQVVIAGTYYAIVPANNPIVGTYAYSAASTSLWTHVASPAPNENGVYWVAISRDGKWAASAGGHHKVAPRTSDVGYLFAHDMTTEQHYEILYGGNGGVNVVALSGDGSYLVAGADKAYVFKRDGTPFGAPIVLMKQLSAADSVTAVAISDDGKWVICGASTGHVVLYQTNAVSGAGNSVLWRAPTGHYIKSIAMATDGSGFAVVTTNKANVGTGYPIECNAYFFKLGSSLPTTLAPDKIWPLTFNGHGCIGTLAVAISADGSRVAAVGNVDEGAGSTSGAVFLFDTASQTPLWARKTDRGPNSVSVYSTGGACLVAASDGFGPNSPGKFYLFDANGIPISGVLTDQPTAISWSIQISADGSAIAAASDDSKVYRFETAVV